MAAELIPASDPRLPHRVRLPRPDSALGPVEEIRQALPRLPLRGPAGLEAEGWSLCLPELRQLRDLLAEAGLRLERVCSDCPQTHVAAAALGLETDWPAAGPAPVEPLRGEELTIHRGTLRSGDQLSAWGSVLQLGDVNPGATVTAGGHVLIWGRLRGVAHAGCRGDRTARIVALKLQPLQLRIADAVARGPAESPPAGLAEQAHLVEKEIRIDPASANWPLEPRDSPGGWT
jgi:septum site-determining protein MinC